MAHIAYPELDLMMAIPNGGKRDKITAARMKAEGVRAGAPDILLPVARSGYHGLFIELKHDKNKPSEAQTSFLTALTEQGYYAVPIWGWQDAIQLISNYLDGKL